MKNKLDAKELLNKWKSLPIKTKNLVFIILGVAILLASYMLGFSKLQEKTTAVEAEIATQKTLLEELKTYEANISVYEAQIVDAKNVINENLSRLPCGVKNEDFLLYMMDVNEQTGAQMSSISFDEDELALSFDTMIDDSTMTVNGYLTGVTVNETMNYQQLKDFIDFIYNKTQGITYIDSASLTYDSETADLTCSFKIDKFYIDYENAVYEPVDGPDVPLGKENIFGAN